MNSAIRVVQLDEGTVFTIHNKFTLMFENNLFYEVELIGYKIPPFINPIWNRTGKFYTTEEVNLLK